ncbi:MAG: hypothetical protein JWO36_729, partial [Myxococcales bacterium]|nr:hypothetical protein [Myxococcales bacterium]
WYSTGSDASASSRTGGQRQGYVIAAANDVSVIHVSVIDIAIIRGSLTGTTPDQAPKLGAWN